MEKFKVGDLVQVKEPFSGILPTENLRIIKLDVPCWRKGEEIKAHRVYREKSSKSVPLGEDRLEHVTKSESKPKLSPTACDLIRSTEIAEESSEPWHCLYYQKPEPEPKPEFTAVPEYITRTIESTSFPQAMWRLPIE